MTAGGAPTAPASSTMVLALEQERVNGVAKIVDYRVAFDGDSAGIWIDLDLDDVAAIGEGLRRRHAMMRSVESGLQAGR